MHHLQQQRDRAGHWLLKHSHSPALLLLLLLYASFLFACSYFLHFFLLSFFAHFAPCVWVFWIQHSCFPEIVHIISASPPLHYHLLFLLSPGVLLPPAQLHSFLPIWGGFPTSSNKTINLQHINLCAKVQKCELVDRLIRVCTAGNHWKCLDYHVAFSRFEKCLKF